MIKMSGAALILLASFLTSGILLKEKRDQHRLLVDLKNSLLYLSREIGERGAPLGECFEILAEGNDGKTARSFFHAIAEDLPSVGEKPFSAIWQDCVQKQLFLLSDQEKDVLLPLGQALGRCDPSRLCETLDTTVQALEERITQLNSGNGNYRRIAFGIPLSFGAIAVIMLI